MFNIITNYASITIEFIEDIATRPFWILRCAIFMWLIFSIFYFPEAILKRLSNSWNSQDRAIQAFINEKISKPFKPYTQASEGDHLRKRDLRFTPYVVGGLLGLNSAKIFYAQVLLFSAFIYALIKGINNISKDPVIAIFGTICFIYCYVGNSFNFDTLFLDSLAYLGLVSAFLFRRVLGVIPILLLTYFVDERSIIPSLILPLITFIEANRPITSMENYKGTFLKIIGNRTFIYVFIALILYFLIRLFLYTAMTLNTPIGRDSGVALGLAFDQGSKLPIAIFSALKMNFAILIFGIIYIFQKKSYLVASWILVVFLMSFAIALSVEDVTRSLAYAFPVALPIYLFVNDSSTRNHTRKVMFVFAAISIFSPTYTLILDLVFIRPLNWLL